MPTSIYRTHSSIPSNRRSPAIGIWSTSNDTQVSTDAANPTFNEVEVSQTAMPTETEYVDFIPTLGKTTITGDDTESILFLAAENKLKSPTELPTLMKGFRAYFQLKDVSTARSFQLNLGEEATSISEE